MGVPLYRSATIVPLCRSKITWIVFQLSNKPYEEVYPLVPWLQKMGILVPRPRSSIPSSRELGFLVLEALVSMYTLQATKGRPLFADGTSKSSTSELQVS